MAARVTINGYYGFGNFGDDLLLLSTYKIVRRLLPAAEITVFTWSRNPSYIKFLIPSATIRNDTMPPSDVIIHGGGGVFFDFEAGSVKDLIYNRIISTLTPELYSRIVRVIRRKSPKSLRIGIGLGVGSYTASSKRFRYEILHLADFKFLMVRDEGSIANLASIGITNAIIGTDLVFDFPFNEYVDESRPENAQEIALILRDWKYDGSAYLDEMLKVAMQLRNEGHLVKVFSFDPGADQQFISKFKAFVQVLWNPERPAAISEFLSSLRKCRVIVSSRAHGIIVAAALQIPSVGINLEPKIEAVVKMVPESSSIVLPGSSTEVLNAIQRMIARRPPDDFMQRALLRNRKILSESLDKLSHALKTII